MMTPIQRWSAPLPPVDLREMLRYAACREMDEQVLALGNGDRKAYSAVLLSFAANRRFPAPSPLAFGEGEVRSRITNALNEAELKFGVELATKTGADLIIPENIKSMF